MEINRTISQNDVDSLFSNPSFESISQLSRARIPFIFLVSFEKDDIRLFPLTADTDQILYQFPTEANTTSVLSDQSVDFTIENKDFERYYQQFENIQQEIAAGRISQINLTQATPITLNHSLQTVYDCAHALYKLYLPDEFVVFSPETFIQIKNNTLITHPMKGTIDSALAAAADRIMNDEKEQDEHMKVIEMVRDELSQVSQHVWVERYRYISEVKSKTKNLLQVSSDVRALLSPNWQDNLGELLDTLLPAASICGVPKQEAIDVIHATEGYKRGFYTGVMGVFDGEALDSAVMIRFIEVNDNHYLYKSGGGITKMSQVESEFNELINKIYVPIH